MSESLKRVRSSPITMTVESDKHPTFSYPTDEVDIKTRHFCKSCNSGWMGRIEDEVQPILEPMMLGQVKTVTLSPDNQVSLSRWAFKTNLVAEFALRGPRMVPTSWYTDFYARRRPPDIGVVVWATAYGGTRRAVFGHKRTFSILADWPIPNSEATQRTETTATLTTLTAFRAIFQVFCCFGWKWHPSKNGGIGSEQYLIRIWPPTNASVVWPKNGIFLDDATLEAFAAREDFM
jgi:hypothetical protein